LRLIEPLGRYYGYDKDFRGFDRQRMVNSFVAGDTIEAPEAIELPDRDFCLGLFRYRICDGVHRYFASIAAGYSMIHCGFRNLFIDGYDLLVDQLEVSRIEIQQPELPRLPGSASATACVFSAPATTGPTLGACLRSLCSIGDDSDSRWVDEQVFSTLED
jgi:hypothetical protein